MTMDYWELNKGVPIHVAVPRITIILDTMAIALGSHAVLDLADALV